MAATPKAPPAPGPVVDASAVPFHDAIADEEVDEAHVGFDDDGEAPKGDVAVDDDLHAEAEFAVMDAIVDRRVSSYVHTHEFHLCRFLKISHVWWQCF